MFMATQIASTPTVKGKEALRIYREANKKPSAKAALGAEKLKNSLKVIVKWKSKSLGKSIFLQ